MIARERNRLLGGRGASTIRLVLVTMPRYVCLDDPVVDPGGQPEVIGVDDQARQGAQLPASSGWSDGVQAQAAPRRRFRPSRSSIVCSTE